MRAVVANHGALCRRMHRAAAVSEHVCDDAAMAVLVDPPMWPAHDRLWAHLVSDRSLEELHDFARRADVPERAFDVDHYDVPAERIDALVAAGALRVSANELTRRLIASGLRVPARERRA